MATRDSGPLADCARVLALRTGPRTAPWPDTTPLGGFFRFTGYRLGFVVVITVEHIFDLRICSKRCFIGNFHLTLEESQVSLAFGRMSNIRKEAGFGRKTQPVSLDDFG